MWLHAAAIYCFASASVCRKTFRRFNSYAYHGLSDVAYAMLVCVCVEMVVGERPTSSIVTISLERLLKIRGIKKGLSKEDKAAITIESSTSPACAKRKKS